MFHSFNKQPLTNRFALLFTVPAGVAVAVAGTTTPTVGDMVTINCAVSPGTPTTSTISWYRDGTLITGETSATYTFTSAIADQGVRYTCQVDNGLTSTASVELELLGESWIDGEPDKWNWRRARNTWAMECQNHAWPFTNPNSLKNSLQ